jgi:hypothetical protein
MRYHSIILFIANKAQWKRSEYQRFVCQMYHMCLARVFAPLQVGMTSPDVVHCPDSHLCRAIYSLGPYIADYPEQVWLAGIVQGWCPKYIHHSDKFARASTDLLQMRGEAKGLR